MTETGDTNQKLSWISVENRQDKRFDNTYRVEVPGSGAYLVRAKDEQGAAVAVVRELGYEPVDAIAKKSRIERVAPEGRRPGSPGIAAGRLIPRADFDDPLPPDLLAEFEGEGSDRASPAEPSLQVEQVVQALRWELCAPSDAVDVVPEDLPEIWTVEVVEDGLRLRFKDNQYFRLQVTREDGVPE